MSKYVASKVVRSHTVKTAQRSTRVSAAPRQVRSPHQVLGELRDGEDEDEVVEELER